jgi:hypothetical protein
MGALFLRSGDALCSALSRAFVLSWVGPASVPVISVWPADIGFISPCPFIEDQFQFACHVNWRSYSERKPLPDLRE